MASAAATPSDIEEFLGGPLVTWVDYYLQVNLQVFDVCVELAASYMCAETRVSHCIRVFN